MDLRRVGHPPQYVFSRIDELKAKVAARGVDVIDFARAHVDDQVDVVGRARLTLETGDERAGEHVRHAGLVERCDDAF